MSKNKIIKNNPTRVRPTVYIADILMAPFAGKFVKALAFAASTPSYSTIPLRQHSQRQQQQQQQQQVEQPHADTSTSSGPGVVVDITKMCRSFGVDEPGATNLYLHCSEITGRRGLRVRREVRDGDVVLSIPLSSCLRDDNPPSWYRGVTSDADDDDENDGNDGDDESDDAMAWSTRLAALVLDVIDPPYREASNDLEGGGGGLGGEEYSRWEAWRASLPDASDLRASLPVHWDERAACSARCTSLEIAIDESYFARANAISRLVGVRGGRRDRGRRTPGSSTPPRMADGVDLNVGSKEIESDTMEFRRKCHDALDIVQTRACRVDRKCEDGVQWGPPLRVIAPVFDYINHGSSSSSGMTTIVDGRRRRPPRIRGGANARFGVEDMRLFDLREARLVVRATRDIMMGEEVLIDYGDSTRPQWRCLASYGFVPSEEVEGVWSDGDDDDDSNANIVNASVYDRKDSEVAVAEDDDVAELWMNGRRFEVDSLSVPFELVEVAAAQALLDDDAPISEFDLEDGDEEDEGIEGGLIGENAGSLAPSVARAIAKRATETAFNLIIEPEIASLEEDLETPGFVCAMSLAASLRWSQHRVLLTFAENLKEFYSNSSSASSLSTTEG
ncbi:hypothetical protein ACHAXA_002900 [Cyclostephanos tholiformis]|uniref:SET domain-containing protein n=1 Tax=Cyclostephanos tholiformis TaxID=382380 RepID=A0ABD3SGD0_9STRA